MRQKSVRTRNSVNGSIKAKQLDIQSTIHEEASNWETYIQQNEGKIIWHFKTFDKIFANISNNPKYKVTLCFHSKDEHIIVQF